jgi:hypothetical protein
LHWRVQVLLLCGGHQKVIDVVGDWYEASIEQQVLGACIESFQGHVISSRTRRISGCFSWT